MIGIRNNARNRFPGNTRRTAIKFLALTLFSSFLLSSLASPAHAMRFWRFKISQDGKPAFSGGIGMSDRTPPAEVIRQGLLGAKIQLAKDSVLGEEVTGDITLDGVIEFSFPDLPPLQLDKIRLVHSPSKTQHAGGRNYDWQLHPSDAATIINHYAPAAPTPAAPTFNLILILTGALFGVVLFTLIFILALRGKKSEAAAE